MLFTAFIHELMHTLSIQWQIVGQRVINKQKNTKERPWKWVSTSHAVAEIQTALKTIYSVENMPYIGLVVFQCKVRVVIVPGYARRVYR